MSILAPGFSERVFEFSFNAEYADRNRSVLAGVPDIPTQNKEKSLGYDVKFRLQARGGATHAVALQHKTSRYVDQIGPKSRHFWRAAGGPYFGFRLDVDQFNLIERLSSAAGPEIEFHFCAPLFASHSDMSTHFMSKAVETNSIWISVSGAGQITADEPHSIIYTKDGSRAFLFSEKAVELTVLGQEQRRTRRNERQNATLDRLAEVYDEVLAAVQAYWEANQTTPVEGANRERALPTRPPTRQEPSAESLAALLADYVGMSVLMEVRW